LPANEFTEARSLLSRLVSLWFDPSIELRPEDRDLLSKTGSSAGEKFYMGQWTESLNEMTGFVPLLEKYKK
jgi:hypothetical protein